MSKSSLLSSLRTEIRRLNYSYRTEQAYTTWTVRFVKFHDLQHPSRLNEKAVVEYLSYLAEERNVAGSTQNQALCAIVFLYKQVLDLPLGSFYNLPVTSKQKLKNQIKKVKLIHKKDLNKGYGEIILPKALSKKYPELNKSGKGVKIPIDTS